jgi:DNA adenine methylase
LHTVDLHQADSSWDLIVPDFEDDPVWLTKAPQVFRSPGGKHYVADRLVRMMPPHITYVEPFAGSAAVFFKKPPSPVEVLGDLRENLIDTYRWIRDTPSFEPLFKMPWRASRARFNYLKRWKPKTPVGKAYKFLWISRSCLLNAPGEGYSPVLARKSLHPPIKSRFAEWQKRLKHTILLRKDAFKVIPQFDSAHTFFYLDPPYPRGRYADLYGKNEMGMKTLSRLFDLLKSVQGQWIMSLNYASIPHPLPAGVHLRRMAILYPALPTSVERKDGSKLGREPHIRMEVLLSNFVIHEHA